MKRLIYNFSIMIVLVGSLVVLPGCFSSSPSTAGNRYSGPDWAPAYEPGVRYYYIPDIETYYDVSQRSFIYLDQGRWISSYDLPPMYRGYDLYNGYHVMLDRRVYEPWRYHQSYMSTYPRYYYRNMYGNEPDRSVRGYKENARKPVYTSPSDRSRRSGTRTTPSTSPATSPSPDVNTGSSQRQTQTTENSRRVGKPVRVTPEMRQPRESSPTGVTTRRQSQSAGTGTGTSSERVQPKRSTTTTPSPEVRRENRRSQQETKTDSKSGSGERRQNNRR